MSLAQLRTLWSAERSAYRRSEIGSGVQRFVWEVLKSEDFFRLKQGLKSTPEHERRSEFLLEERRKDGRADAAIFMNAEVVIPVEVERFEQASHGEWQIHKYRTVFEKRYGILTDGFEWRFYYGEIADELYYLLTLDEMFTDPERFRVFWEEYVKPANYYLSFFESVGQQSLFSADVPRPVDKHRKQFFLDVTEIVRKLKDKLLNAGYFKSLAASSEGSESERNKTATETAYSYLIQFVLYKTLVDNGFPTFEDDFSKKSEIVHRNLKRGSFGQVLAILEGISERISENIYKPFHAEQELVVKEVRELLHAGEDTLLSAAPFLDIFLLIRRYDFGNVQNDIFGAVYENYLKELYDEQLGQFFTDPEVVNFMLSEVGYQSSLLETRRRDEISIVDPSCGSGTFLYSAIRELVTAVADGSEAAARRVEDEVRANVFGLDIAEFPLYLAEMSILMRLLPLILSEKYNNPVEKKLRLYVTEDSLAEFIEDVGEGDQKDLDLGWTYHGFMRDEADLSEMKFSLKDQADGCTGSGIPRRRFDFVVGNPPYIGYNEASAKVRVKLFRMMKERAAKLSDVYGWNLHSTPARRKTYPPKPNLYSFFMALGFALLKEGGRFCYIIPQTVLTETDHDVVRYHLSHDYTIESLITFAGKLFVGRSIEQTKEIHTSSLIVVCTKQRPAEAHDVECVSVPDRPDEDVRAVLNALRESRRQIAHRVPQSELRKSIDNWNFVTWEPSLAAFYERYKVHSESMAVYSEHRAAENRFGSRFYFDVGFILDRHKERGCAAGDDVWGVVRFQDFLNFTNFRPTVFYPCNEDDIGLPKNAQGHEALYRRHKLVWEKARKFKFYYTDADVIPSMSHCQIISSDHREEILFLFAVLNSSVSRRVFEALYSVDHEKVGMYVTVSRLKTFLRPPLVDTAEKARLKRRVIGLVERALEMEARTLGDVVKVDTLVQRVDEVRVEGDRLLAGYRGRGLAFEIDREHAALVADAIAEVDFGEELFGDRQSVSVSELKSLPAFDRAAQLALLRGADEGVLDLYGVEPSERQGLRAWAVQ